MEKCTRVALLLGLWLTADLAMASQSLKKFFHKDLEKNVGCGPGAVVFDRDSWLSTSAATSLNATSSPLLPTSTTSKLSGCNGGPSNVVYEQPAVKFIHDNYFLLASDIADGEGEVLTAFNELLEIPKVQRLDFNRHLKSHFSRLYSQTSRPADELYQEILILTEGLRFDVEEASL